MLAFLPKHRIVLLCSTDLYDMGPLGNVVKLIYRLEELAGVGGQHGGEEGSLKFFICRKSI